jgi:hypothetical protein
MKYISFLLSFSILFFSCKIHKRESSTLTVRFNQSPQPPVPDYSLADNWAALPQKSDAADRASKGLYEAQSTARADVFFVHPTTYIDKPEDSFQWNASLSNAEINMSVDERPILYQASVFNESCRVYAPRYRQAHYYCFLTTNLADKQAALDLAYADVKASFEYYLSHYNQGRPIVIAGHSQGTIHAGRLLQEFFQNKPMQNQLVAAYLIGMPIPSDSLPYMQPCEDSTQTGCYLSWRTFLTGYTPKWKAGNPELLVCQNPLSWTRSTELVSAVNNHGAVLKNFDKVYPQVCNTQVHEGLLWISKPRFPGSRLYKNPNYHIADYNLFYINIRENVALRVKEFLGE